MRKLKIFIGTFLAVTFFGAFIVALLLTGWVSPTTTDSMEPTHMVGKYWSITNPFETPGVGDVVSFKCNDKVKCKGVYTWLISHRLTEIKPDGCMVIIGDNPKYDWSMNPCYYPDEIDIRGVDHVLFTLDTP